MHMSVHWSYPITIFFEEYILIRCRWSNDSWIFYIVCCLISGVFASATIIAPHFKKKLLKQYETNSKMSPLDILLHFAYYFLYASLHVATMILIMTYNGGLIIFTILCMAVSYYLFGSHDSDGDMPVNCCSNSTD